MLRSLYADHTNHNQKFCKRKNFLPSVFIIPYPANVENMVSS